MGQDASPGGKSVPRLRSAATYEKGRLARRAVWAPDGTCFLCAGEGGLLQVFDNRDEQQLLPQVEAREGESVRDVAWYPLMTSSDWVTCVFASCSRDCPVHLWDAYTGEVRASYRCYNAVDEITAPYAVGFTASGQRLVCGFESRLNVFEVARPGRDYVECAVAKGKRGYGQRGILATVATSSSQPDTLLLGSFAGTVGVYSERDLGRKGPELVLQCNKTGVSSVKLAADGTTVAVAGRCDDEIQVWDLRSPARKVLSLWRSSRTNQRIGIDIQPHSSILFAADRSGMVRTYDLNTGEVLNAHPCSTECVSDVGVHPVASTFVTTHGERVFPAPPTCESPTLASPDAGVNPQVEPVPALPDDSIRVWDFHTPLEQCSQADQAALSES